MGDDQRSIQNANQNANQSAITDASASSRRAFIKAAGLGAALALPIASSLFGAKASAQKDGGAKLNMVKETDPNALALGYKEDAAKVDVKKYPKRAGPDGKTQFCYNCTFFQAKTKDPKAEGAAVCTIFAGKAVKSMAWCNSWAKKA